jgi:hypothetical protein
MRCTRCWSAVLDAPCAAQQAVGCVCRCRLQGCGVDIGYSMLLMLRPAGVADDWMCGFAVACIASMSCSCLQLLPCRTVAHRGASGVRA